MGEEKLLLRLAGPGLETETLLQQEKVVLRYAARLTGKQGDIYYRLNFFV